MDAKDKKMVQAAKVAVAPQKILQDQFRTFELAPTLHAYLDFLPEESSGKKLADLVPDLELHWGRKAADLEPDIREWYYRSMLMIGLNSKAADVVLHSAHRVELTELVLGIKDLFLASNSAAWTDTIDRSQFAVMLIESRERIASSLRELKSVSAAAGSISERHGHGRSLLHKSIAEQIDCIYQRTIELGSQYSLIREEFLSVAAAATAEPCKICPLDLNAIEEQAVGESPEVVKHLEAHAKKQMQIAFE